ncbi:MAG: 2OG-Fe(II) oxygenase [Caulobacteraceae bacterium]
MPLLPGDSIPFFIARTPSNPRFVFDQAAGRYLVLAFLPRERSAAAAAIQAVRERRHIFDDQRCTFFGVLRDPAAIAEAVEEPPGIYWILDADGEASKAFQIEEKDAELGRWIVLDPTVRVLLTAPLSALEVLDQVAALPSADNHAGTRLHAPALIVPRVFEPAMCQRLIALYEANGGQSSGFMVEVDGQTVEVHQPSGKRRSDFWIDDDTLKSELNARLLRWLAPSIAKAFQFTPTRIERHLVSCYDAKDAGFFRAHRDNTTKATAHRRFAVTLNLNADDYEGGDLRFPEFGSATYRAPTGGAIVFSCSLLHEAEPVTRGRRYAFLPFLYDEAGAKIREANSGFLASNPGAYGAG